MGGLTAGLVRYAGKTTVIESNPPRGRGPRAAAR